MKLSDQVTSLELSKKLKEIGIKQESQFYWVKNNKKNMAPEDICLASEEIEKTFGLLNSNDGKKLTTLTYYRIKPIISTECIEIYSAFTVPELLELFPISGAYYKLIKCQDEAYQCLENHLDKQLAFDDYNAANACAKMLIHLGGKVRSILWRLDNETRRSSSVTDTK